MRGFFQSLRRYAVFNGRSGRAEYWSFCAYVTTLAVLLAAADATLGLMSYAIGLGWLSGVFILATTLPLLAVTSRRMHDAGWPGWLALLHLVPVAGSAVVSLAALKGSQPGRNAWGEPPAATGSWRALAANALVLALVAGGGLAAVGALSANVMASALARDGGGYEAAGLGFGTDRPAAACVDEALRPGPAHLPMLAPGDHVGQVALARRWLGACLGASGPAESRFQLCAQVPSLRDPMAATAWTLARCQPMGPGTRCGALLQEVMAFCQGGGLASAVR